MKRFPPVFLILLMVVTTDQAANYTYCYWQIRIPRGIHNIVFKSSIYKFTKIILNEEIRRSKTILKLDFCPSWVE